MHGENLSKETFFYKLVDLLLEHPSMNNVNIPKEVLSCLAGTRTSQMEKICVLKCAKLCVNILKCVKLCQSVPSCAKACQSRDNSNILRSLAQFGTVWHSLATFDIYRHSYAHIIEYCHV